MIISQHQPVVEKYYGQGRMLNVAQILQEECDRQGCSLIDNWFEERRMDKKLSETKLHKFTLLTSLSSAAAASSLLAATNQSSGNATPLNLTTAPLNIKALNASLRQFSSTPVPQQAAANPSVVEEDVIDAKEIDVVLTELAQISSRWELYRRFLYSNLAVCSFYHCLYPLLRF